MGSGAKSLIRKGFLIYKEMRKYLTIFEEAVSHIYMYDFEPDLFWVSLYIGEIFFSFLSVYYFLKYIVSRDDTFMFADGFTIFGTAYCYNI